MALMAASRRETEAPPLPFLLALLAPLLAIGLDSYLPAHLPFTAILDLPLLVVVYFATVKRSPVVGACAGGVIGILQDALTQQPLGVNGITKTVVGYIAGLLGNRIDTDNPVARLLFLFILFWLHSVCYWVLVHKLLTEPLAWSWIHELVRASVNAPVGVVLFALFDRTRGRDR
jgi:rod shape-determining protein MreD